VRASGRLEHALNGQGGRSQEEHTQEVSIMETLIVAAIGATVLTPAVIDSFARFRAAVLDALRVRAEVSEVMAEAYRRRLR
jgi:hypothetical protein